MKQFFEQIKLLQVEIEQLPGIEVPEQALDGLTSKVKLEQLITDEELLKLVSKLFSDGYHAQAVTKACLFLDNLVKNKSGNASISGDSLMRHTFSVKNPILKLNDLSNNSDEDEQQGYMDIFAGVMKGIRNPRSHEHDWEDSEFRALQLLCLIDHLVERVRTANKV